MQDGPQGVLGCGGRGAPLTEPTTEPTPNARGPLTAMASIDTDTPACRTPRPRPPLAWAGISAPAQASTTCSAPLTPGRVWPTARVC